MRIVHVIPALLNQIIGKTKSLLRLYKLRIECGLNPFDWWRLRRLPRYKGGAVPILGTTIEFVDVMTLLRGLEEIYLDGCYEFHLSNNKSPFIVDCGANIGLAVFYFKKIYPDARIVAIEADPDIFEVLKRNVTNAGLTDVDLINAAVWDSEEQLSFRTEGGSSGRIAMVGDEHKLTSIRGVRLRDLLDQKVNLLKIDIEGAEARVIKDCAEKLINVDRIILEYHSHHSEPQNMAEILENLSSSGFRYYIKEAYVPNAPFISCPTLDGMDLQLNIYAMRQVQN